jgi:hypothetical protein
MGSAAQRLSFLISVFAPAVAFADTPHDVRRTFLLAPNATWEKVTDGFAFDEGPEPDAPADNGRVVAGNRCPPCGPLQSPAISARIQLPIGSRAGTLEVDAIDTVTGKL